MEGNPYTDIARVCWSTNLALQVVDGEAVPDVPWDAAPDWRRRLCTQAVELVDCGNILTAQEAHERWRGEMLRAGWRPGQHKNPEDRLHPSLVPWQQLSPRQRLGQELFIEITLRMLRVAEGQH
jgi:RyR domain-containing protein